MRMTKQEIETVINFNDAEKVAYIQTRQKSMKNRMKKLGVEPSHTQAGYEALKFLKKSIKIRLPRKLSKKQLETRRATLDKINSEKNPDVRVREPRIEH